MTAPRQDRTAVSDELLSITDVCAELGIARATFHRWRARRKGPEALTLPGGGIRIRRSALDRFLANCETPRR